MCTNGKIALMTDCDRDRYMKNLNLRNIFAKMAQWCLRELLPTGR